MWCANDGNVKKLCPLSFGFAVGVVGFLVVFIETLWTVYYGPSPWMTAMHMPEPTIYGGFIHGLCVFVKGFFIGFFVAFIYDYFVCCMAKCCKGKDKE